MMSNQVPDAVIARVFPEEPTRPSRQDEISLRVSRAAPQGPDAEVEAIRATCAALEALDDPAARRRVLQWAQARFTTEPSWQPPPARKP